MMDALRSSDSFSRHRRQLAKRIRDAQQHLTVRLGRVPTPQEMADKLELTLEAYWSALEKTTPVTYVRIEDVDSPDGEDTGRQFGETLPARDGEDAMDILVREESRQKIRDAIGALSERKRQCVILYYGREMTLAEIAAVFKVTPSRVSQILSECRKDLKRHLKGEVTTLDLALKVAL
jgi:RNA polymerase sigma factor for flagellar operon FliA